MYFLIFQHTLMTMLQYTWMFFTLLQLTQEWAEIVTCSSQYHKSSENSGKNIGFLSFLALTFWSNSSMNSCRLLKIWSLKVSDPERIFNAKQCIIFQKGYWLWGLFSCKATLWTVTSVFKKVSICWNYENLLLQCI